MRSRDAAAVSQSSECRNRYGATDIPTSRSLCLCEHIHPEHISHRDLRCAAERNWNCLARCTQDANKMLFWYERNWRVTKKSPNRGTRSAAASPSGASHHRHVKYRCYWSHPSHTSMNQFTTGILKKKKKKKVSCMHSLYYAYMALLCNFANFILSTLCSSSSVSVLSHTLLAHIAVGGGLCNKYNGLCICNR